MWILVLLFLSSGNFRPIAFLWRSVITFAGIFLIVQVNLRLLIPHFYFRKKWIQFWLGALLLLVATVLLLHSHELPWLDLMNEASGRKNRGRRASRLASLKFMANLTPYLVTFLGSTLIEVASFANRKEKEAVQLEKEMLETELKFLKSQVNPHFLFNALNNIYSLSVMKSPQTSESLMQLSEILRYMVYDASEEQVPLKHELNYIENYVQLKLLKDSRGMQVRVDLQDVGEQLKIAPLLFIPFVENAFKHSRIEDLKKGFVNIRFSLENKLVEFRVENSMPAAISTKDRVGGVGLDNIKKRLNLLYPNDRHQLIIVKTDERYLTILKIELA